MWKYIGEGAWVPGVPARDLTDEEHEEHVKALRLPKGSPAAAIYKQEVKAPAQKEGDSDGRSNR